MKKLLISLSLILICYISFGQAIVQRSGVGNTVQDARLSAQYNLFVPRYADTTAALASNSEGIDSCGAIIFTYDQMALWFRSCSGGKSWVMLDPSGIPSTGNSWIIGGNAGLFTSPVDPQYIGTKTVQGFGIKTSDVNRLIMPAAGLSLLTLQSDTTLNKPMTYNTSTKEWNYGYWFGGGSGGAVPISSLTAATGSNTISNASYTQQWAWALTGSQTALQLVNTSTTSAGSEKVLEILTNGTHASNNITTFGQNITNAHDGTGSINIGLRSQATNGDENIAAWFNRGKVRFGTVGTESGLLEINGSTSGTITIQPQAAAGTYNFNLPTTAGTSGYLLTSAGGAGSPMTWTDPASIAPTFQQSLINGSTLTQPNDIEADGYDFRINDAGELGLAGDSITLSANAGSNHLHIKGDSSSLNKRISYESDLSSTFTQYSLVDKNYVDGPYIYGEYLNTTFPGASLPTGFTKLDGAATITFNNPSITYTGGTGNKSDNYIRNTDTSSSNNYDYTWEFTLDTKFDAYAGQGKWFGKQSLDNTTIYNGIVYFGYGGSSSLARMKLALPSGTGNGTAVDSSGTITMADGNDYRLVFSQRQNLIYVKLSLLSAGTEVESVYIYYRVAMNANNVLPNLGVAAFGSLDGTSAITITNFAINYNDYVDANAVVIGTSISQGFRTSSMNNAYIEKAFKGSGKTFVNMASGGLNYVDMYALLPRAERLNPTNYIVEIGVNDGGMAVATFRGHLQALYDSVVTSYGKTLILIKDFSNATYDTIYYNFAAENNLTLIDPAAVMTSAAYDPDLIHPNDLGNDIYASACKRALPALFGNEVVNDRYSLQGLNDVVLGTLSDDQVLRYNSTTSKWNNETLSGFVNLQSGAITQQTGGFGVTGYGEVGTGLSVGTTNTVGVLFKAYGNTVQDATTRVENNNSASTSGNKYLRISQMGVTAYGVADWPSASVVTSFTNGGLVLGAYHGSVLFQTGTSYTTRANFGTNGLYMGGNTAATARLHLAASTTSASSGQIKFVEGSNLTTPEDGNLNYVSNNLNFTEGSTVYTLAKTLTNTATLDFGNTAAGVAADLTITVTGAAVGDAVYVGVDNASVSADNITFWGWVSATNTVTVRFNNNNLVSAVDPASGTFRVVVTKY